MKTNFTTTSRRTLLTLGSLLICFSASVQGEETPEANGKPTSTAEATPPKADPQMQAVLDQLLALKGRPIVECTPEEARKQPSPADAVKKLMEAQGKKGPEKVDTVDNITIKLSTGDIKGRVYRPAGDGPFPVILYFHGGGWVIADLDTYDATPRALANSVGAVVISAHYSQGPEHRFPAAHNDAFGAYAWTLENAGKYKGDAKRIAVVGESAGGNLAANVSMMAQDKGIQLPVHEVLVYPVANYSFDTPSYRENYKAMPLSANMMPWFFDNYLNSAEEGKDVRISLLSAKTFKGLPSTTIITAQIDPLRSEGEALARKMKADGVAVSYKNYDGVTHEFFGMGAVVDKAKEAEDFVSGNLKAAFEGKAPDTTKSE